MSRLGTYFVGDSIKITTVLDSAPTSVTLDVWDSAGTQQITAQAMTMDSAKVYSYTFQTTSLWPDGIVTILTTATTSTFTNVQEDTVLLTPLKY